MTDSFKAKVAKVGINPYVRVPKDVLDALRKASGKERGPIPVRGELNGVAFVQTVVKFRGVWRLYLNTQMRKDAGLEVGEQVRLALRYDPRPRDVPIPDALRRALAADPAARAAFHAERPSERRQILLYLNSLKKEETRERVVAKAIRKLKASMRRR